MELKRFLAALEKRQGRFDAIDVGSLFAILLLEAHLSLPAEERKDAIAAHLGLLDRQLALSHVPEELRLMVAGVRDAVLDWYAEGLEVGGASA
jgi:hypothetical protein